MYREFIISLVLILSATGLIAQRSTISGYIKNGENGEAIIGASIYVPEIEGGAVTNVYGFYSISVKPGDYTLVFSYVGFQSQEKKVSLQESTTLNLEMQPSDVELQEVIVEGERQDQNVTSIEMSTERIDVKTVQKMPAFLGEPDVINSLVLLPGVSNVGEGANGFNVRGGNVDQNLILLDGAPVYSSSHLFGFFSVFNTDAIKDVKLYKGGIPAEYGGRLSSVLEIRQKEGNAKKFAGTASISSIATRATIEGPLIKDRMTFLASGRISYVGYLALFSEETRDNNFYFYDLNGKVNYRLNEKNRIFLSGYYGNDVIILGGDSDFKMIWGNGTATFRWNRVINDKIFSNLSIIYSNYDYLLGSTDESDGFDWKSKIRNYNLKYDWTYYATTRNTVKFGISALEYQFAPGKLVATSEGSFFNEIEVPQENALELGIYASNEQKIGNRLTVQYGLRYSHFINHGASEVNEYENGVPRDPEDPNSFDAENEITGTTVYDPWEIIDDFGGIEPRISANFLINDRNSVKASYNRTRQYIHLVSNTTSPLPIDVWKPAGRYIQPAVADQVALGYFRNLRNNLFELSAEIFYKKFYGLLDFVNGADLLLNENVEQEFLSGNGEAYGLELQFEKKKGKTTGWISYTLSRSKRQVWGINNNEKYPSNYDKPHDLSVVIFHEFSKKFELSVIFNYQRGKPITYPDGRYEYEDYIIPNYSNRNGARMPDYHRLDLALNWTPDFNPEARIKGKWNLSVFNVYARRNAYSVSFRQNEDYPRYTEAVKVSALGTILPSIGYSLKF